MILFIKQLYIQQLLNSHFQDISYFGTYILNILQNKCTWLELSSLLLHFLYYFPLEFNTKITTPIKFLRNDKTQATRTYFLSELIHVPGICILSVSGLWNLIRLFTSVTVNKVNNLLSKIQSMWGSSIINRRVYNYGLTWESRYSKREGMDSSTWSPSES